MQKDKILICDDEEPVRKSLGLILSDRYDLIFAEGGNEALDILKTNLGIKMVLLDIKMPEKNGLAALKEIKSYNNEVAVIIVTGYQSIEAAAEAIKSGASNYIVKPLDSKNVLDTIEKSLS
ncbi:MAG: response regulator [Candidatus Omnitrophota bacterium]